MSEQRAVLPLVWPIDLELTVSSHGWVHLAPFCWDGERGVLARTERVGKRLGRVAVRQSGPAAIEIGWHGFGARQMPALSTRVRRWLSAEWDPAAARAALREHRALIERGGGRMLRGSNFYEDFVKTVLTINTNWTASCRMVAALVAEPGGGAFPTPCAILDYGEARLRERAKLGFRAATLARTTRQMLEDGVIDESGEAPEPDWPDYDYLLGLKGIGPYAAAHCRLLLGDFSRIPIDSSVTQHLRERYASTPAEFADSRAHWGNHLALGYRLERLAHKLEGAAPNLAPAERVA
jgi:3-methyladenine DNA glycosylase/8-oxoguanine DNA glycosylase